MNDEKNKFTFIYIIFYLIGCNVKNEKASIHKIFNKDGKIIEVFGIKDAKENDGFIHDFYKYDREGKLTSIKMYECKDSNCLVKDTNDYIEQRYLYDKQKLLLKQTYWTIYGTNNKVINHKLFSEKNYINGKYKQYINE